MLTEAESLTVETIARMIAEATGRKSRVLDTGGGCQVVAWRSADFVCWLSSDDAGVPTDTADGLVLGIYDPDPSGVLWPSESTCEGLRFYYANEATPATLAALLVEAREDIR